ncbi:MAG: NUDIX domain-containing protein [Endomicrobium sp.]|jgi:8-oxo-dGTP pyrophosphatase MutT (NUDIX family)|nr:NUDIX domain-containing protein [Endomicrobium sp.]
MFKEFSCGAIVYKEEGGEILFLIVHSKRNNEWGFPKGHREKGESEKQTAKREIFEETGIKDIEFIDGFRYEEVYPIKRKQTIEKHSIYFLAKSGGEAKGSVDDEIDECKCAQLDAALNHLKFENQKNILKEANKKIEIGGKQNGKSIT